ncbi:hypothetical protein Taro_027613, partial [Colocasia esculenta]|nr:hypothetical protein [Colocasia esculenta]
MATSPVGCPRFSVSQAVSSGLCPGTCVVPSRSVSFDLDTLTPLLELYVRMRERRQWDSDCCTCLLVTCSALIVGSTGTSCRHWSPASPFPVPHSRGPRPRSLKVPGMGLQPCGPQFTAFIPVFLVCSVLGEFPTEPVTSEAHPYPHSRMYNSSKGVRVSRSDDTDLDGTTQVPGQSLELTAWLTENLGHPTGEAWTRHSATEKHINHKKEFHKKKNKAMVATWSDDESSNCNEESSTLDENEVCFMVGSSEEQ